MPLTEANVIVVPVETRKQIITLVKDQPKTQLISKQPRYVTVTYNFFESTTLIVPNEERKVSLT